MRYVVEVGEGLWLAEEGSFRVTPELEEAVVYLDPVAAARAVVRVSTEAPVLDPHGVGPGTLNRPLLLGGARVQRLDEARETR